MVQAVPALDPDSDPIPQTQTQRQTQIQIDKHTVDEPTCFQLQLLCSRKSAPGLDQIFLRQLFGDFGLLRLQLGPVDYLKYTNRKRVRGWVMVVAVVAVVAVGGCARMVYLAM
jgi:hypothetical protein